VEKIIKAAVERGASDLHIRAGDVVRARIDGVLVPLTKLRLTPEQTKALALRFLPGEEERARIDRLQDYDCSWGVPGLGRFRVNILRQRSSFMIVMRVIPFDVPTIEQLGLPAVLQSVASAERGLVLVTGATDSGRSSTSAALVDAINRTAQKHIVTLENPIEFLHRDIRCSLTQREIGTDTESVRTGLRAALRQDADVVLIGEARDADTIDIAMTAVETGRLLLATLTAPDVSATVSAIVAMFPPGQEDVVRLRLADTLHAVVSQRLLRRKDGQGRVAAVEVMIVTPAIRELIRDRDRASELREAIAEGRQASGMQTLDQHLMDLVRSDLVAYDLAVANAVDPSDFELRMRAVRRKARISSAHPAAALAAPETTPPPGAGTED
jgi:twitching motility protein PilT